VSVDMLDPSQAMSVDGKCFSSGWGGAFAINVQNGDSMASA
jgi:hypothetical protein